MAGQCPAALFKMKKILLLVILVSIVGWHLSKSNDFAVWFNTDNFYRPIFSAKFDVAQPGYTVRAQLFHRYDVTHGFFLEFPYKDFDIDKFSELDGVILYTFSSKGVVLKSERLAVPSRPMGGGKNGMRDLVLFTFELPYAKGVQDVTLEVILISPITDLLPYSDVVNCKVAPAYWPK